MNHARIVVAALVQWTLMSIVIGLVYKPAMAAQTN